MTRMASIVMALSIALAESTLVPEALAATVRYGGQNAELSVSAVSERTVQIVLAPLDEKGNARPGPMETNLQPDPAELRNAVVEPICRTYLELRYRLLPYNYTLMREACDTGLPPMRALWLHHPDDAEAVKLGDEYLWGRDLLVAPVVEKGAKSRRIYLPAGTWYDWWTSEKVAGPRWVERPVDLATLPCTCGRAPSCRSTPCASTPRSP